MCRRKLEVTFVDNPQRDNLDLTASINYPNASLSTASIDFGSVLFDTLKTEAVTVTNTSEVPVKYNWDLPAANTSAAGDRRHATADTEAPFDIKPINGYLQPGEREAARVTYFARAGPPVDAAAVLRVRGGPAATLQLTAAPNSMAFTLEPRDVDFGSCQYDESATKTLILDNPSKCAAVEPTGRMLCAHARACCLHTQCCTEQASVVFGDMALQNLLKCRVPVEWSFNAAAASPTHVLTCTPAHGTVRANSKQTITLKASPGLPDQLRITAQFDIAHFDPVIIHGTVKGECGMLATSLPRASNEAWPQELARAAKGLLDTKRQAESSPPPSPKRGGRPGTSQSGAKFLHLLVPPLAQ